MNEGDIKPKPKSVRYYLKIIYKGDGNQWHNLFEECKNDYDIAFTVAQAIGRIDPEKETIRHMWKNAIECLQPGININFDGGQDEDLKARALKQQKYS